jgi:hypothetical protein
MFRLTAERHFARDLFERGAIDDLDLRPALRQRFSSLTGALPKSSRSESPAEPDHHIARFCAPARNRLHSRAAEQRDELAAFHSITSSAIASTPGGIVRPSVLAVLRFITSSNLVGCNTGRSAGFSPLRMRPV